MKLLRVGNKGQEKVAALDSDNTIRDLSDHIQDLNPTTINETTLQKLSQIDFSKLEEVNAKTRIGSCISNPVDFLAIGLNYKAHAEGTNSKLPAEPILFNKSSGCIQGPNDSLLKPKTANKMDYEVEIAIVIFNLTFVFFLLQQLAYLYQIICFSRISLSIIKQC